MKPFLIAALVYGFGDSIASGQWQPQAIKSDADFRGLCAVSPKVAWVTAKGDGWAVGPKGRIAKFVKAE